MKISNVEQNTTSVGNFLINLNNGNVKHLILEGNVFSADVADSKLINIYNTVVSIGTISLIGNTTKSTWGINNNSTQSFTVLASGNRFDCSSHVIRQAGTSGTVKYIGSSNDYVANTNIARPISAGLLAVYDWGAPVDIQYLGNSDGQHCYNTNSGQAGGVGLVMANGTSWAKI